MTWTGFDGHAYTRTEFAAHVAATRWTDWKPKGVTLHNTAAPRLDQWAESGPSHDARIRNLQAYYETQLGWHAGPHLFISRNFINGFADLTKPGVHSRCFNATHIGIEMVGDYAVEAFDSGDGAMVRDNAVFAMATLYPALGLDPGGLVFHKECTRDNHDCPGKNVKKPDVIARVRAALAGEHAVDPPALPLTEPWHAPDWQRFEPPASPRTAWAQDALNRNAPRLPPLAVDGLSGPLTRNALAVFQRTEGLPDHGAADDRTINRLKEKTT